MADSSDSDGGEGRERRRPRAPEPRPVAQGAERSLLVSRHLADSEPRAPRATGTPSPMAAQPEAASQMATPPIATSPTATPPTVAPPNTAPQVAAPDPAERRVDQVAPARRRDAGHGRGGDTRSLPGLPEANPIVPPQSVAGRALILVVGIMCFLACLAVGALVLVQEAARDWQLDVAREVTIQVKPVDGKPIEPMLQSAMDLARQTAGVRNVRLMSERDSSNLLEPWLGSGVDLSALPIPRLILIELADPASADLYGLSQRLSTTLPNALLDDHSIWAKRLRTMAGTMVAAGGIVLVLVLTAMVLSVVFATRAAMAGNRDVIEVLHFVGAEDSFVAGEFQQHFLILGLKGGVGGGLSAMISFAAADWVTRETPGLPGSDQLHALFGGFSVGWSGYVGAAGIVLLVAGLTALTSRLTVRSYLNQID